MIKIDFKFADNLEFLNTITDSNESEDECLNSQMLLFIKLLESLA